MKKQTEIIGTIEINWDAPFDELNKKREELRQVMVKLQNDAAIYRQAIEKIDLLKEAEFRQKWINTCIRRREYDSIDTYAKIYEFDESCRPRAVTVIVVDDIPRSIDFEQIIWDEDLKISSEISESHFNEVLNNAIKILTKKING
jgi:hypothetical protein